MAGWVSLVPQAEFSLSIPLVLAQGKVRVHTRTRTWRGRSLPTPVPLAFPPITSLSVPCLWLPRQGILGEVLGGGGTGGGVAPHWTLPTASPPACLGGMSWHSVLSARTPPPHLSLQPIRVCMWGGVGTPC